MDPRSEFRNVSGGYAGVQVKDHTGRMRGVPVAPGATIWLDEDEQVATANAPRKDEDNPFTDGTFELLTPAAEIVNRRPIGHSEKQQVNEVGAAAAEGSPGGPQPEGVAASSGGDEDSPPGESDEPEQPADGGSEDKPEKAPEEMSQAERDEQNAKEAAKRAVKDGQPPASGPQQADETGAAVEPAGKAPEGKRMQTEQVGTPEAAVKG